MGVEWWFVAIDPSTGEEIEPELRYDPESTDPEEIDAVLSGKPMGPLAALVAARSPRFSAEEFDPNDPTMMGPTLIDGDELKERAKAICDIPFNQFALAETILAISAHDVDPGDEQAFVDGCIDAAKRLQQFLSQVLDQHVAIRYYVE